MPQFRWGGSGALSTAELAAGAVLAVARFEDFDDDARFFLAAMRTLSGLTGRDAPTLSSACMTAGTFYGGLVVVPRPASHRDLGVSLP